MPLVPIWNEGFFVLGNIILSHITDMARPFQKVKLIVCTRDFEGYAMDVTTIR